MTMLQMEYELLEEALKKLPNNSKLLNALLNVALKVEFAYTSNQ